MIASAVASSSPVLAKVWIAPRGMKRVAARPHVVGCALEGERHRSLHAVDRLLVRVVAMRDREARACGDIEFVDSDYPIGFGRLDPWTDCQCANEDLVMGDRRHVSSGLKVVNCLDCI